MKPTLAALVICLASGLVGPARATPAAPPPTAPEAAPSTPRFADDWKTLTVDAVQVRILLPTGYTPRRRYPVLLYLHQLDMGDWPSGLMQEIDPWFESAQWQARYPCIVICPLLDQKKDESGRTINFGGVTPADQPGEDAAIAAVRLVLGAYSCDPSRIYVTGNSMGGIGTWDMIVKYNAIDGAEGRIFAAAMPLAGATYDHGYPVPDPAVVAELARVPIWAIHGANDNQVPPAWDKAMAAALAGSRTFHFTLDPALGHDVWDTYYPLPNGRPYWDWLFKQRARQARPAAGPLPD